MDDFKKREEKIKKLFIARIILWCISFSATAYWVIWSFKLYDMEIYDPHYYATALRPRLYAGLAIAIVCLLISLNLRHRSDRLKRHNIINPEQ